MFTLAALCSAAARSSEVPEMGDFYIKPGNQDRGWNDPPQFSYGLQTNAGGPKRNVLNKRVPPPQLTAQNPESQVVCPPPISSAPPSKPVPPPAGGFTPPPKGLGSSARIPDSQSCSVKTQPESSVLESEPNIDDVQKPIRWALAACRQSVKKQVCDDVERRLMIFEEMWTSGRLSLPVKCRMNGLSRELSEKSWDKADEIHRGLMVDYVNEVSQWMVGIKRLIAETRKLSPELLQTGATVQADVDLVQ